MAVSDQEFEFSKTLILVWSGLYKEFLQLSTRLVNYQLYFPQDKWPGTLFSVAYLVFYSIEKAGALDVSKVMTARKLRLLTYRLLCPRGVGVGRRWCSRINVE